MGLQGVTMCKHQTSYGVSVVRFEDLPECVQAAKVARMRRETPGMTDEEIRHRLELLGERFLMGRVDM